MRAAVNVTSPNEGTMLASHGAHELELRMETTSSSGNPEWDRIAAICPYSSSSHSWLWTVVLAKSMNLVPLPLTFYAHGALVGIFPTFRLRDRQSNILWSPTDLLWDYGGPCIEPSSASALLPPLMKELERWAKSRGFTRLQFSPRWDSPWRSAFERMHYEVRPRMTLLVSLAKPEDVLRNSIRKKWRQYVRRAERANVTIRTARSLSDVDAIHGLVASTLRRHNAHVPPQALFREIYYHLQSNRIAQFRMATVSGEIIAGDLLLKFNGAVSERFRGSDPTKLDLFPNHYMVWDAIRKSKEDGFRLYDLGGIGDNPRDGVRYFKEGFGGIPTPIPWYRKDFGVRRILRGAKRALVAVRDGGGAGPR